MITKLERVLLDNQKYLTEWIFVLYKMSRKGIKIEVVDGVCPKVQPPISGTSSSFEGLTFENNILNVRPIYLYGFQRKCYDELRQGPGPGPLWGLASMGTS